MSSEILWPIVALFLGSGLLGLGFIYLQSVATTRRLYNLQLEELRGECSRWAGAARQSGEKLLNELDTARARLMEVEDGLRRLDARMPVGPGVIGPRRTG